ncbi:MAG: universal stress protein [Candidatus Binataceae bacterium]
MKIKRILVPIDFSVSSLKALDYAVEYARPHRAELLLLHVVEPITHMWMVPDVAKLMEQHRAKATEQLTKLEKRTKHRYRKCRSEVHSGIPYVVITNLAEKSKADLIITATHGHTGLHHLFLGSVAERVVRLAKCPVLTLRVVEARSRKQATPTGTARASASFGVGSSILAGGRSRATSNA